ncbi:MAG TPA: ATP-binding protein [Actinocrinis sp.]|nr:ATP-binding protein [Actinocrinis sp.]
MSSGLPSRPDDMFDRENEWDALARWVSRPTEHASLGVLSGRRRMGKTYLLRALTEQVGGLYFGATAATEAESLRQFGQALAEHVRAPGAFTFGTWDEAITALFRAAKSASRTAPMVVAIDEFPYLAKEAQELPSVVQRELDRYQREPLALRLLLCGSAMATMGRLLAGSAPLRGRASLEIVVPPFGYRDAADYWGVQHDPELALLHNAVLGGTPAYRAFLDADAPMSRADFEPWLLRSVLRSSSPLFREARYLLGEEMEIRDPALYHSVLAAVAEGNATRGGIAGYIGRNSADIAHPLNVLEDCHLLRREADLFRKNRSLYRINEPLITFYEAIMRPLWPALSQGRPEPAWQRSAARFTAQVVGPHFEWICREFMVTEGAELFPDAPLQEVGSGTVTDSARRETIEIDVAVIETGTSAAARRVVALGEAKWGTRLGLPHLERLEHARELLAAQGWRADGAVPLLISGIGGFSPHLEAAAAQGRARLLTLADLYGGCG